jgi:hypothetical protein
LTKPVYQKQKIKRRNVIANANRHKTYDKRLRLAEVIAGRTSMYGVFFGGSNWVLTGVDVVDQTHYLPFVAVAALSTGIVVNSILKAEKKLLKKEFESYATRNTGRLFMLIFAYMFVASLLN